MSTLYQDAFNLGFHEKLSGVVTETLGNANPWGLLGALPAGAIAALTPTRTDREQDEAEGDSVSNMLVPGMAAYNQWKRVGHSNQASRDRAEKKEEKKEEKAAGFLFKCAEAGLSQEAAAHLLKQAFPEISLAPAWKYMAHYGKNPALIGAGVGAGLGAAGGALRNTYREEDNQAPLLQDTLLGMGAGGLAGAGIGGGGGALNGLRHRAADQSNLDAFKNFFGG